MEDRPYQKLIVWQEAHGLCMKIYQCTAKYPAHEQFGLASQMKRSGYSVPTNIVEGNARRSSKEKIHFIDIALASLEELHYQTFLSKDLRYVNEEQAKDIFSHIGRTGYLLQRLRSSLK